MKFLLFYGIPIFSFFIQINSNFHNFFVFSRNNFLIIYSDSIILNLVFSNIFQVQAITTGFKI